MIKEILVPVDKPEHASKAIDFATDLAKKFDATIHLLHVVKRAKIPEELTDYVKTEGIKDTPDAVYLQYLGNRIIRAAEDEAKRKGGKRIQRSVVTGDPAEEIVAYARDKHLDMIVLGSQGLGSVSRKVCKEAGSTCVIVRKSLLDGKKNSHS
jgi:nucleotide-binding universal stress UspA family protein